MSQPKALCYFEGENFWTQFDAQRAEYAGPDARFKILKDGDRYFVQFCNADGDGGTAINESHICPGSPGC